MELPDGNLSVWDPGIVGDDFTHFAPMPAPVAFLQCKHTRASTLLEEKSVKDSFENICFAVAKISMIDTCDGMTTA